MEKLQFHVWNSDVVFSFENGVLQMETDAFVDGPKHDLSISNNIGLSLKEKDFEDLIDFLQKAKKEAFPEKKES